MITSRSARTVTWCSAEPPFIPVFYVFRVFRVFRGFRGAGQAVAVTVPRSRVLLTGRTVALTALYLSQGESQ